MKLSLKVQDHFLTAAAMVAVAAVRLAVFFIAAVALYLFFASGSYNRALTLEERRLLARQLLAHPSAHEEPSSGEPESSNEPSASPHEGNDTHESPGAQ